MKHVPEEARIELTRRNLTALLAKLDDPQSLRTLFDGPTGFAVTAVEDAAHYSDRDAGLVYMPSSGELWPSPVHGRSDD